MGVDVCLTYCKLFKNKFQGQMVFRNRMNKDLWTIMDCLRMSDDDVCQRCFYRNLEIYNIRVSWLQLTKIQCKVPEIILPLWSIISMTWKDYDKLDFNGSKSKGLRHCDTLQGIRSPAVHSWNQSIVWLAISTCALFKVEVTFAQLNLLKAVFDKTETQVAHVF